MEIYVKLLDFLNLVQVLKGHIALGNAIFPNGTNGITKFDYFASDSLGIILASLHFKHENLATFSLKILVGHSLDILARIPLWKYGLDYRHGTGHGIGSYLNVHEGIDQLSQFPFP
jgi:Xaa-Pro aminopeptidase